jgi:hypothetical protein
MLQKYDFFVSRRASVADFQAQNVGPTGESGGENGRGGRLARENGGLFDKGSPLWSKNLRVFQQNAGQRRGERLFCAQSLAKRGRMLIFAT